MPVLHALLGGFAFVGLWLAAWGVDSGEWNTFLVAAVFVAVVGAALSGITAFAAARFRWWYSVLFASSALAIALLASVGLVHGLIRPFLFWLITGGVMFIASLSGGIFGRYYGKQR